MSLIDVKKAAEILGVSDRRVRYLIADGVLLATKVGQQWVLDEDEVNEFASKRTGQEGSEDEEKQQ